MSGTFYFKVIDKQINSEPALGIFYYYYYYCRENLR